MMTPPEPHRPRLHFSAAAGWINDPNGLIQVDGIWHLFFQHDPHSTRHGPMHWGHASSPDLVHWTEHPVALYPDALGTCFSGSAVETPDGEIKLIYTAHRKHADGSDYQVQCLVQADRALATFQSDPRNPVVANPGLGAFRDPKVFWHASTQRWIMVLTHGQSIGIRSSTDLVEWTLESEFGATEGRHGAGPWECPDLLPLTAPDGSTHWVLLVSIGSDAYGGGSGTQYFVGDFDGHRFVNVNPPEMVLWVDYGRDYYAVQTFSGAQRPTTIAWASNWQYARHTPTGAFRGVMSLPRELSLVATSAGYRLLQTVPTAIASAFTPLKPGDVPQSGTYVLRTSLDLEAGQSFSIALFGETDPQIVIASPQEGRLTIRTKRSAAPGIPDFAHDYHVDLDSSSVDLELFVDNGLTELQLGNGLAWITNLYFPDDHAGPVRFADGSD